MAGNGDSTIVIKKIKKGGGGHHGGAWKVAYADFVTAMMAFFLLLWLLASTSESQKEGIAEYFTPTIGLRESMGIGFEGGEAPTEDGTKKDDLTPVGITPGFTPSGPTAEDPKKEAMVEAEQEAQLFEKANEEIKKAFEDDPSLRELSENIIVEQTPEGLKIEIVDSDKHPMFKSGSAVLSDYGRIIIGKLAVVIEKMPNYISITGHTDAGAMKSRGANYTNWELSAERANAARRYFAEKGMSAERVGKVVGMADKDLLLPDQPLAERNRRITVILLRGSHYSASSYLQNRPGSLLNVPKLDETLLKKNAPASTPTAEAPKEALPVAPAPSSQPVFTPEATR